MNFCETYNKIMNWYEKMSVKFGAGTLFMYQSRNNRIEINVIEGLGWLIVTPIYVITIVILTLIYRICCKLFKITTSKCPIADRTEQERMDKSFR